MSDNNKLLPIIMLGIKSRNEEAKVCRFKNRTRKPQKTVLCACKANISRDETQ
jgi:hypothetical protein